MCCANRKICCDDQQLTCDYVNDEEHKNEIVHVDNEIETEHAVSKKLIEVIEDLQMKIENLTRKVDSLKELLSPTI
jgi:hypothetical protein